MELSRKTDYALRTMVELAADPDGLVSAAELARRTLVPYSFLTKILMDLSSHRLVAVSRGRAGGVRMAVDPGQTTALQVIEAMSGPLSFNRCVVEPKSCPRSFYCSVHDMCAAASRELKKALSVDLKTLAAANRRKSRKEVRK